MSAGASSINVPILCSIGAFPGLSSCPVLPQDFAREGIDSDPLEGRVLLAELQKMTEGLIGASCRHEQLARPPLQRLPAKLHFD